MQAPLAQLARRGTSLPVLGGGNLDEATEFMVSLFPIPVIGSIARGTPNGCSMRGAMEPRIEQFSR